MITMKLVTSEVSPVKLADLTRGLSPESLARVRADFGERLKRSANKNFEAGGRPTPWQPSRRALREGGKTLVLHGHLKSSIVARVEGEYVLLGSNLPYARAHQLGVAKQVTQRVTGHLRAGQDGREHFVRAHARTRFMRLPARPFLLVQEEDLAYLRRRLLALAQGGQA